VADGVPAPPADTAPAREEAAGRRRSGSLRIAPTLAACIGLLVAVAVAAAAVPGFLASRDNALELIGELAEAEIGLAEARLRDHLDPAANQLAYLAQLLADRGIDPHDTGRMYPVLAGALAATPQIVMIVYIDTDGRMFGIVRTDESVEPFERRADDRDGVAEALARLSEDATPYWGEVVFLDGLGLSAVNRRHPVHRDDRLHGMLVAAVTTRELSRFLRELRDAALGDTPFILYGRDDMLAHPGLPDTVPGLSDAHPLPPVGAAGDRVLSRLWDGGRAAPFEADRLRARIVEIDGDERLVIYTELTGYTAEPLVLGIHYPLSVLDAPFNRILHSGLIAVAALLLAVAAGVVIGHRLARPVRRLARSAARIGGELDFAAVPDLPGSVFTELDDQARAFNRMLHGLRWLETYVPRQLARRLVARGAAAGFESVERELTVMFTDIAGFTAAAETLPAADTAGFLNRHFALLAACVEAEGGTIDKFIGDALMAFWGAPDPQPDHAARACRAARAMAAALHADNAARIAAGKPAVHLRVGIHSGRMVAGNIGAPGRMNYTIVGDAVNTGARLEQLGKTLVPDAPDVVILVSGATAAQAGPDVALVPCGRHPVRGRHEGIEVFRLLPDGGGDPGS
jgi:class 3 adenylate cyclase